MSIRVARTCTEIELGDDGCVVAGERRPLSEFRSTPTYVLLGDPGAGKTTEFLSECEALGSAAKYLRARDFAALDVDSHPEWRNRTLFIDGLDEMRAGAVDSRVPLDEIRNRLDQLRPLGFRLSCRGADWLGRNDRQSLEVVSLDSRVAVVRLDPLDEESIRELLVSLIPHGDVTGFVDEARRWGIWPLLENPLTLELLVGAVNQGETWPRSRHETFELACKELASEQNDEHQVGDASESPETVMGAAGYLCALQLLAGIEGYSLPSGPHDSSFVPVHDLEEAPSDISRDSLKRALATRMFTVGSETTFRPLHRQVAEFLGGRFLARLVEDGLPARRVTALMTGPGDGRVVTELRGLSAWLAAHSGEARSLLIDADPVGTGLYGDIESFNTEDKKRLLGSLATFAEQDSLVGHGWRIDIDTGWTFRSLASRDMVPVIEDLIDLEEVDAPADRVVEFVLTVLSNADRDLEALASLAPRLDAILHNLETPAPVRQSALDAYLHVAPAGDDKTVVLRKLLTAFHDRTLPDPDEQLRGTLLDHLYPSELSPAEVWQYVTSRNNRTLLGRFWRFWTRTLEKKSSDQQVAELLDALYEDTFAIVDLLAVSGFEDVPVRLLARGLETIGDDLESSRLYNWLSTIPRPIRSRDEHDRVHAWLRDRPEVQKEVFLTSLTVADSQDTVLLHYSFMDLLYGNGLPADYGRWCLEQAIALKSTEPIVSRELLREAYVSLRDPSISNDLTLETMRAAVSEQGAMSGWLDEIRDRSLRASLTHDEHSRKMEKLREQQLKKESKRHEDWTNYLRSHVTVLRGNELSSQNLHALASAYFKKLPSGHIDDLTGGDPCLIDAVMTALRGAIWRDDVPEVDTTIALYSQSRMPYLTYPVLVSMDLLRDEPEVLRDLDENQKRRILAIYYCSSLHNQDARPWYDEWLDQDPVMVLDVLYRCAVAALRDGSDFLPGVNTLDDITGHDELKYGTRLKLLEAFPTRIPKKQLRMFDRLLRSVLTHPTDSNPNSLIGKKLNMKSLNVSHRIRWMMVDALVSGGIRIQQLFDYVGTNERRIRILAEFLYNSSRGLRQDSVLSDCREPVMIASLIDMLGRSYGPQDLDGLGTVEINTSEFIMILIRQLSSMTDAEARKGLAKLVDDPELVRWRDRLRRAQELQRVVYRDASYSHPGIDQVQRTLNDLVPANAADLAALLCDKLKSISEYIQGANSNLWRQFWNEDSYGRPTTPKPEESGRDALLEALKQRLPSEIDISPEGRYSSDKRADIRASYGGFNIPIEIKKSSGEALRSGLRTQLINRYTTDPATSGYGIFLVLWFGDSETKHPPYGKRPTTPEELRRQLEVDLTADEERKISVIVMDVTKPEA